tara:strand:+ start:54 stop:818 length:765 start_codon:yes stop_codon:yes gene_type:complete
MEEAFSDNFYSKFFILVTINDKLFKMKKIILFITIMLPLALSAQAFTAVKIKVNDGSQGSVAQLIDDHYKDANFREGSGFNIERLWQGSGEWTHRIVFYGELGNSGRIDGDMSPFQNSAFWSNLRLYTKGHYEASSGRVLEWKEGDEEQDNFIVYDVTIKDMSAYMKAHQKFIDELSEEDNFKNRGFAVGTYDIGRPNGAWHWIILTGKDTDDLMLMHQEMQTKYLKQLTNYFVNRGEVEEIKDYRVEILKSYN